MASSSLDNNCNPNIADKKNPPQDAKYPFPVADVKNIFICQGLEVAYDDSRALMQNETLTSENKWTAKSEHCVFNDTERE
eukprot:scaffold2482_cov50-Cyclotella_meneghiniana.AAC.5